MLTADAVGELSQAAMSTSADYARCRYEDRLTHTIRVSATGGAYSMVNRSAGGLAQIFSGQTMGLSQFTGPGTAHAAVCGCQPVLKTRTPISPATPPVVQLKQEWAEPDPNAVRDRAGLLGQLVEALAGQRFVLSATGTLRVSSSHRLFADSAGSRLSWGSEMWRAEVAMLVSNGQVFRPLHVAIMADDVDYVAPASIVEEAAHMVMADLVEPGRYDVILHPDVTALLIHEAVGHTLEADYHLANPALAEQCRPGTTVGIRELSVVDQLPTAVPDDEGTVSERVDLIREGVIVGRLHSLETAALTGERPTGNGRASDWRFTPIPRMRSMVMSSGSVADSDLLADTKCGIYVRRAVSGDTDGWNVALSATLAYRIDNGRLSAPVAGVSLSGTARELLLAIDGIGSHVVSGVTGTCNKRGQSGLPTGAAAPHVRLRGVQLG